MPHEHPSVTRFRDALDRAGGTGEVVVLPDGVHTAALAAAALGCEVGAIANSLLFDADGEPVLVLTSGAHRVDTAAVAARTGRRRLRRASPDFVREHTGQVIGGVSPLDHPAPLTTYVDPWLRRHPVLWAAAGHPAAVFSTTFEELVRMTGAVEVDVEPARTGGTTEVWVDAACSKSRAVREALDAAGAAYDVRVHAEQPPTPAELAAVLARLGLEPWEVARTAEAEEAGFADLPRGPGHRDAWLAALCAHPRAIQRPLVLAPGGAVVARGDEAVARAVGLAVGAQP